MNTKLNFTTYLAAAIEHNKVVQNAQEEDWKTFFKKEFSNTKQSVGIYDPVEREQQKTNQSCGVANQYIKNLKRAGQWNIFDDIMNLIWWGSIKPGTDKLTVLQAVRNDWRLHGNTVNDLNDFADYQAVIRSDFIVAYMEKEVKTVGVIKEIHTAYLLNIPIVLILPDQVPTEANSTLLSMVRDSGGKVCANVKDAVDFIKEKFKIK